MHTDDAFEALVLAAHTAADDAPVSRVDAALDATSALDAETQAKAAAALLAHPAHAHTPWGAALADALAAAVAMRMSHDALAMAREATPDTKNALRRWAATDAPSGYGGSLGWAGPPPAARPWVGRRRYVSDGHGCVELDLD